MARDTVAQLAPPPIRPTEKPDELQMMLQSVQQQYPRLRNIPAVIQRREGPGYIEYYPPHEGMNPNPGKVTLEMRDMSQGANRDFLHNMIAGDLLHYLGGTDEAGKPYDSKFYKLKKDFEKTLTPDQHDINKRQYQRYLSGGQINPNTTYQQFLDMSGTDQYVRGYLFPDPNNEWKQPGKGEYTLKQILLMNKMRDYLHGKHP